MAKNISILIPDGESPVLLIVLNCLSEIKGLKIHVMSNDNDIPMKKSKFVHNFSYYPKTEFETDLITNINIELEKFQIDLIMPIFEHSIYTLLKHKNKVPFNDKLALLPSFSNFNKANNKGLLAEFLEEKNLPYPKSLLLEKNSKIDFKKIDYPVLVKPIEGIGGGMGIFVFNHEEEFKEFIQSEEFNCTYLAQDYIDGYDIDCSVLCKNGEIITYTIQKATMYGATLFEPQYGIEFIHDFKLLEVVKKLMKDLNWSGVAHLDMRYDIQTNEYKVIEVNPRFWGSVEGSLFAGINFPYLYCLSSLDIAYPNPTYKDINFLNLKGLVKSIKENKRILFQVKFIFNNTPIKYMLKDPNPTLFRLSRFIKRKFKK